MKKTLTDIAVFQCVIPGLVVAILLLAGAGIFAWGIGALFFAAGERIVKNRKQQAAQLAEPVEAEDLILVEMDVQMKYRDKSHDFRVIN